MRINKTRTPNEAGFALLISLIVVGVVLSVGMTILDLSTKQVKLATNARDSEVAFYATSAGVECAQYWRRKASSSMENGEDIYPVCFGSDEESDDEIERYTNTYAEITGAENISGMGKIHQYKYQFTWGKEGAVRCSDINTIVLNADPNGGDDGLKLFDVTRFMPGFPASSTNPFRKIDFKCHAGSRCTLMSVRGYNKKCESIYSYGTVQREVLLQF